MAYCLGMSEPVARIPKRQSSRDVVANEGLRERKKREMRRRIARQATNLFVARGFDNVTLDDIAAAAKVSKMTVLNYFPCKEDLFFNVGDHVFPLIQNALAKRGRSSPLATLRALVEERANRQASPIVDRKIARYWRTVSESSTLRARALQLLLSTEQGLGALLLASVSAPKDERVAQLISTLLVGAWRVAFSEAVRSLRAENAPPVGTIFRDTLECAFDAAAVIARGTEYV